MARFLVVDGHSVIFTLPHLRSLHSRQPRLARGALIEVLETLHDSSSWRVTLVFDGKQGTCEPHQPGRMVILYAPEQATADSIIERLVGQAENPSEVTVVTADEAERLTVASLGAMTFSPEMLEDELNRAQTSLNESLRSVRKQAKW